MRRKMREIVDKEITIATQWLKEDIKLLEAKLTKC